MKNKILLWILIFILLISFSYGYSSPDNFRNFWSFDNEDTAGTIAIDYANLTNLTNNINVITGQTGYLNESYRYSSTAQTTWNDNYAWNNNSFTWVIDYYAYSNTGHILNVIDHTQAYISIGTSTISLVRNNPGVNTYVTPPTPSINQWNNVIFTWSNTTGRVVAWINGQKYVATQSCVLDSVHCFNDNGENTNYFGSAGGISYFDGLLDNIVLYSYAVNDTEADNIYSDFTSKISFKTPVVINNTGNETNATGQPTYFNLDYTNTNIIFIIIFLVLFIILYFLFLINNNFVYATILSIFIFVTGFIMMFSNWNRIISLFIIILGFMFITLSNK